MFSFQGRSTRWQFAEIIIADIIFVAVVVGAYMWVGKNMGGISGVPTAVMAVVLFVLSALTVPLLVATSAVAVRRFHDRGKSGWWALSILVVVGIFEGAFVKGVSGKNEYGDEIIPVATPAPVSAPQAPVQTPTPSSQAGAVPPKVVVPPPTIPVQPVPTQTTSSAPVVQTPPSQPTSAPVQVTPPQVQVKPVTPAPQVPPVEAKPAQPVATPSQQSVPQARSMTEMLAELQKLAQQQGEITNKAVSLQASTPGVTGAQPQTTPTVKPTQAPVQTSTPSSQAGAVPPKVVVPPPTIPASAPVPSTPVQSVPTQTVPGNLATETPQKSTLGK